MGEGKGGRVGQESVSGSVEGLDFCKCTSGSQKGKTTYPHKIASLMALECIIIISCLACKKCTQS